MKNKIIPIRAIARTLASERLRQARLAAGLSQERAAQELGVDPRQVGRWERGEVPLGPLELLVVLEQKERLAA